MRAPSDGPLERMVAGLEGTVAVVTGAGHGLGRAYAVCLASLGASVVLNDLGTTGMAGAQDAADQITTAGGTAFAFAADVATTAGAEALVLHTVERFGTVNALVNNAGITRNSWLTLMSDGDFDSVLDVNLRGTFTTMRAVAQLWRHEGASPDAHRAVVNTTSGSGLHHQPGQVNYASAKAGVAAMTCVASQELARYGVRVNAVAPVARTRLTDDPGLHALFDLEERRVGWDVFAPEHVAPLVAYLASPVCRFTGQVFAAHGSYVGRYQPWSVADEVDHPDGPWTISALVEAMQDLPPSVPVRTPLPMAGR